MLKNKSRIVLVILLLIAVFICPLTLATDDTSSNTAVTTSEKQGDTPTTSNNEEDLASSIHNGDLYLSGTTVVMDKLVDGNVFIVGQNVEITGKVNGNLFVLASNLNFKSGSYIVNSIYACAETIIYDGDSNDLYAICNKIDMTYNSFVVRDLRVASNSLTFTSGVGRNAYIHSKEFTFGTGENAGLIYGNLSYSSNTELELDDSLVQGEINFSKITPIETSNDTIGSKITSLLTVIFTNIIIFLLLLWLTPSFTKNSASYLSKKMLPALGIGVLAFILTPIVSVLLLCSFIGVSVGLLLLGIYLLLIAISCAVLTTCITKKVVEHFKITNKAYSFLIFAGITLLIWIAQQIPYLGGILFVVIPVLGLGILLHYVFTKNKKETSEVVTEEK